MVRKKLRVVYRGWSLVLALLVALPIGLLQGGAIAADATAPATEQSPQATQAPYSTYDLEWTDLSRGRPVPVRLYLPAAASSENPVPLVVFSHGIGGSRSGYSYLGRYWASQGFASLHVQHVGSDTSLWFGNPFGLPGRLRDAAQEDEAIARVHDLHLALDRLLASDLASRIDARHIVAAGHSYGANTALLAVGARVERNGQIMDLRDPRIKAAILISSPPFYGTPAPGRILASVTVPTLHITATEDVIRVPGYYSGAEDRVAVFDAVGGPRKTLAVFAGGSHSMFTDRSGTGGAELNVLVKVATKELALAFMRNVFGASDEPLRRWPTQHSDIVSRYVLGER